MCDCPGCLASHVIRVTSQVRTKGENDNAKMDGSVPTSGSGVEIHAPLNRIRESVVGAQAQQISALQAENAHLRKQFDGLEKELNAAMVELQKAKRETQVAERFAAQLAARFNVLPLNW